MSRSVLIATDASTNNNRNTTSTGFDRRFATARWGCGLERGADAGDDIGAARGEEGGGVGEDARGAVIATGGGCGEDGGENDGTGIDCEDVAGCGTEGRAASSAATRAAAASGVCIGIVPANGRCLAGAAGAELVRCCSGIVLLRSCLVCAGVGIASVPFSISMGSFMSTFVAKSTGSSSTCAAAARFKSVQNAPASA